MAELSLPLKPELKKSLDRYDVRPHDGKISSFEISKMRPEARAQLFESALNGSEAEKHVALALFKKMSDHQILDTLEKFTTKWVKDSCCPAASFYLGALIDQDLPRLQAMYGNRRLEFTKGEANKEGPTPLTLFERRFMLCTLTPEQSVKLNSIFRSWEDYIYEMMSGKPLSPAPTDKK